MPTRPAPFRPATGPGSEADRRERASAYDAKRLAQSETRALYGTARWQGLRAQQLRDQPLCEPCLAEGVVTPATVCDHDTPHRGNVELFWRGPFKSLCRYHHDVVKQREENAKLPRGRGV